MANVDDAPPVGSWRKSVYPVYIDQQAGIGSKPISLFAIGDDKDRALTWTKTIKNVAAIFLLAIGLSAHAGILTTNLGLNKWTKGDLASDYLPKQNTDQNTLDAAILDKRVGGIVNGDLIVNGSIIGAGGIVGSGGGSSVIQDLLPQVNGVNTDFVMTSTPPVGSSIHLFMDGLRQYQGFDFLVSSNVIAMTTAPALNTSSFIVSFSSSVSGVGASTITALAPILGMGTLGNPLRLDTSSVTLLGNKVDLNELSFVPATSLDIAQLSASTGSLQGQINALVGGSSTVTANVPILGIGSSGNPLRLDPSSVTLQGFVALSNLSGAVPPYAVSLDTITAALALKASLSGASFTGAVSVVGTSITANAFFGNGVDLFNTAVAISSSPAATFNMTVNLVGLSTTSITIRHAGDPVNVFGIVSMNNSAGGGRAYTCRISRDSIAITSDFSTAVTSGDVGTLTLVGSDDGVAIGPHDYALLCKTSLAGGTQTATNVKLRVLEF